MLVASLETPAWAQGGERLSIESRVEPPRTQSAETYLEAADAAGVNARATYVDKLSGTLLSDQAIRETRRIRREFSSPTLGGSIGIVIVVVAVIGILLLWLKFGGSGTLLSRKPRELKEKQEAPASWHINEQEQSMDGQALLNHLAAMKDRREALARLLRHCLLSAGEVSETRFARSDTEREAFARLPAGFRYRDALGKLLHDSELAHYGGRPVSEEMFTQNLELGRILLGKGGAHA
ncbi:MAG: hypothetical protein AAGC96_14380 [Pseudomonadota bacterium]